MQQALAYINQWTARLELHPFFSSLRPEPDLRRAMAFAPSGVFWVFTFQDIIRLNAELARDPAIRRILEQHLSEDTGHEEWFLEDLEKIFGSAPTNIRWLFSKANRRVRTSSFSLAGEVFHMKDDRLRLVFVEAIESAAGFFFGSVSRFLAESGHAGKLKYFSGIHLEAEAGHEMHEEARSAELQSILIPPQLRQEAEALVDRTFSSFLQVADVLFEDSQATSAQLIRERAQ